MSNIYHMRLIEWDPRRLFGVGKALHYTGYIGRADYLNSLGSETEKVLVELLSIVVKVAGNLNNELCVLGVGSRADLSFSNLKRNLRYHDVDLVLCTEPPARRLDYQYDLIRILKSETTFQVIKKQSREPFLLQRLALADSEMEFDLSFLGPDGGNTTELQQFHTKHNLAYTLLCLSGLE